MRGAYPDGAWERASGLYFFVVRSVSEAELTAEDILDSRTRGNRSNQAGYQKSPFGVAGFLRCGVHGSIHQRSQDPHRCLLCRKNLTALLYGEAGDV
jgi:hypothetical protein